MKPAEGCDKKSRKQLAKIMVVALAVLGYTNTVEFGGIIDGPGPVVTG